jgi:hypothetical protein
MGSVPGEIYICQLYLTYRHRTARVSSVGGKKIPHILVRMDVLARSRQLVPLRTAINGHKGGGFMDGNGPPVGTQKCKGTRPLRAEAIASAFNLRQKLAQVRREVSYIRKRGRNDAQDYSYAMAADIAGAIGDRLAALNVILGRRNLSIKRSERQHGQGAETVVEVTLDYQFIDGDSDEVLSVPSYGEGRDIGDKAPYKALTGALKYALIQTFLIATGDDPEEEGPEAGGVGGRRSEPVISAEEVRTLKELVEQSGAELDRMLEYFGRPRLEDMTASAYNRAVRMLKRKLSRRHPPHPADARV